MLKPWPPKDPTEVKDYIINWLPELGPADTVASSVWTIVSGTGLVINSNAFTTAFTQVWLSGGTLGQTYMLQNIITSAGGRTETETATLRIWAKPVIVVEDGTAVPTANSYVSEVMLNTYCSDRAIMIPDGDASAALIRATQYIEGHYRGRWPGSRVKYRGQQGLSWPRFGAYADDGSRMIYRGLQQLYGAYADNNYAINIGYFIQPNEIPIELIQAVCEAAIRELATPGYLQPDIVISSLKSKRAGDTQFQYYDHPTAIPLVTVIDGILAPILLTRTDLFGTTDRMT
jgi:hypothetical protein